MTILFNILQAIKTIVYLNKIVVYPSKIVTPSLTLRIDSTIDIKAQT